jgi:hypothetical protein
VEERKENALVTPGANSPQLRMRMLKLAASIVDDDGNHSIDSFCIWRPTFMSTQTRKYL